MSHEERLVLRQPEQTPPLIQYSRLVLIDLDKEGNPITLVQRLKNGLVIFPGGRIEDGEDEIGCLVRECSEEGELSNEMLRQIRNYELLWALTGKLLWKRKSCIQIDTYFMTRWYREIYNGLLTPCDPEIVSVQEITLLALMKGHCTGRVPSNTRRMAKIALSKMDQLI